MNQRLRHIFNSKGQTDREREKFLSRVFGIFSEQIVSVWTCDERSPYENLGRPTIKSAGDDRGYTLDFTLRDRSSRKIYVCEMKCEIELDNYKYFVLSDVSQLNHHKKPAFKAFLKAARPNGDQTVIVNRNRIDSDGAILIWGAVTPEGRDGVMRAVGFYDVLSIERICADLASWSCSRYAALIEQRQKWCNELFVGLLAGRVRKPHHTVVTPGGKQNGVSVPSIDGKCHAAWRLFDSRTWYDDDGALHLPERAEVIKEGVDRGLNEGNLKTEWHYWRKFNGFPSGRDRPRP